MDTGIVWLALVKYSDQCPLRPWSLQSPVFSRLPSVFRFLNLLTSFRNELFHFCDLGQTDGISILDVVVLMLKTRVSSNTVPPNFGDIIFDNSFIDEQLNLLKLKASLE